MKLEGRFADSTRGYGHWIRLRRVKLLLWVSYCSILIRPHFPVHAKGVLKWIPCLCVPCGFHLDGPVHQKKRCIAQPRWKPGRIHMWPVGGAPHCVLEYCGKAKMVHSNKKVPDKWSLRHKIRFIYHNILSRRFISCLQLSHSSLLLHLGLSPNAVQFTGFVCNINVSKNESFVSIIEINSYSV